MPTDTERLDWLDHAGAIGKIRIDPDLEASPFIVWNHWNDHLQPQHPDRKRCPSNVRDAIDLAMKKAKIEEERLNEALAGIGE